MINSGLNPSRSAEAKGTPEDRELVGLSSLEYVRNNAKTGKIEEKRKKKRERVNILSLGVVGFLHYEAKMKDKCASSII